MGGRNEAATSANPIHVNNINNNSSNNNGSNVSASVMALNDNAHLSLAELQQMAAFQQQQIQAQQSLLMAKVLIDESSARMLYL